eukprot:Nk52_evm130s221 gene=Nk52_evmTU130s221
MGDSGQAPPPGYGSYGGGDSSGYSDPQKPPVNYSQGYPPPQQQSYYGPPPGEGYPPPNPTGAPAYGQQLPPGTMTYVTTTTTVMQPPPIHPEQYYMRRLGTTMTVAVVILGIGGLIILLGGLWQYSGWTESRVISVDPSNNKFDAYSGYLGISVHTLGNTRLSNFDLSEASDFIHVSSIIVACICWIIGLIYAYILFSGDPHKSGGLNFPVACVAIFVGFYQMVASIAFMAASIAELHDASTSTWKMDSGPWPAWSFYATEFSGFMIIFQAGALIQIFKSYERAAREAQQSNNVPLQPM